MNTTPVLQDPFVIILPTSPCAQHKKNISSSHIRVPWQNLAEAKLSLNFDPMFLADRTAIHVVWSAIGLILSFVCTSVCLFATKCIVALKIGWKLYCHVLRWRYFLFTSSDTAVKTKHGEKPDRRNICVYNSHGQRDHVTMAFPDSAFRRIGSAVRSAVWATATFLVTHCGQPNQLITWAAVLSKSTPRRRIQNNMMHLYRLQSADITRKAIAGYALSKSSVLEWHLKRPVSNKIMYITKCQTNQVYLINCSCVLISW